MNLTFAEIKSIIHIARKKPGMDTEDIIKAIINGYRKRRFLPLIITNITDLKQLSLRPLRSEILKNVCIVHYLLPELVQSKNRKQEVVRARQQYCLITQLFHYSQESAGEEINKDHATVLFHRKKALSYFETERDYSIEIGMIFKQFSSDFETILKDRITDLINK